MVFSIRHTLDRCNFKKAATVFAVSLNLYLGGEYMEFLSYLISGISLGSIYALIALGYTMVYGIAKMLNFAHGDVIMVGGYAIYTISTTLGLPPFVGIIGAVVVCTLLGVTIEKVAYKPLRKASSLAVLITAIGVSYLLQNSAQLIFGTGTKNFTSVVNIKPIVLFDGGLVISGESVITIVISVVIMIALTLFINKTKPGRAMLAVSEDRGAGSAYGYQCKQHHYAYFRYRFCACSRCGSAPLLLLPRSHSHYGRNAGYQGIYCGCFRRYRLRSRCNDRRNFARYNRKPQQGIHFHTAFRRYCFCSFDYCSSC